MTRRQLTVEQAAERTRQPVASVEQALATGDLRSLSPRDVDAWRIAVIADITKRSRTGESDES